MMHPYSTDSDEHTKITFWISVLAIIIALLTSKLLGTFSVTIPSWMEGPSVLALFGVIYKSFKLRFWRVKFFRKLGLVKIPDLTGKWEGYVISSYDEHKDRHDINASISQNWTEISINTDTDNSHSYSLSASLLVSFGTVLSFDYLNEPKATAIKTMHTHRGYCRVSLSENSNILDGEYYSGRDRQNFGLIHLERKEISND